MAGKCIFNDIWLEMPEFNSWLRRDTSNVYSARCIICPKIITLTSMGISALRSHAKGKKHNDLLAVRSSTSKMGTYFDHFKSEVVQPQSSTSSSVGSTANSIEPLIAKNDVLDAEILWTLKTIKNHFSYKSNENIEKIFQRMFPDSSIAKKFSCGERKSAYYAVFGIAPYLQANLLEDLNKKNFVVLFDESLNIMRQEKQMDIHIRYWHHSKVRTVYFNSVFLGHSTSSDIFESFISAISKLKFSKAIQISMDGPNVNLKFHNMLQEYFFNEFGKKLLNIGTCGLHTVHNAFKSGCKASTWEIDEFLTALYYLFKNSPARREDFLKESEGVMPQKFIQHRWLDNVPASECALNLLPVIKKFIASVDKQSCRSYACIKSLINDNLLAIKLKVFLSIAKVLLPFLKMYQTDKPMLPFLSKDLKTILNTLLQHFILPNVLKSAPTIVKLLNLDVNDVKNHKATESIDLGFSGEKEVHSLYSQGKITDRQIFDLKMECKKFLICTTAKLIEKSPLKYSIVRNLSCLDPRNMANSKKNCINKLGHILNSMTDVKLVDENLCEDILTEFKLFRQCCFKTF